MNVRSVILETAGDFRAMLVDTFRQLWKWRVAVGVVAVVLALAVLWLNRVDNPIDHWLTDERPDATLQLAKRVSYWGDFPTGTLIVVAALWIGGAVFKRRNWRTAAVACLLGAGLAGLGVDCLRFTLGRARPKADMEGRFVGPSLQNHFHGFPSAHAATSFGTATALAVTVPAVGVPLLGGAAGVAWSRMYTRNHFLSDVLAGAVFGIFFGLAAGAAARKR